MTEKKSKANDDEQKRQNTKTAILEIVYAMESVLKNVNVIRINQFNEQHTEDLVALKIYIFEIVQKVYDFAQQLEKEEKQIKQ